MTNEEFKIDGPFFDDVATKALVSWDFEVSRMRQITQAHFNLAEKRAHKAHLFMEALGRLMSETYEELLERDKRENP